MITSFERRIRPAEIAWIAAAVAALALFFGQMAFAATDDVNVGIVSFAFTPAVLTVKPGATIIFENRDSTAHSIVGVGGIFRSKALDTKDTFSVAFDKPGEFTYFCGLHPYMKGKIIVAP
jgi:plastocyanin